MSTTLTSFLDDLMVILVIYRCTPENSPAWVCLVKAVAHYQQPIDLFLYDNSPQPQEFPISPNLRIHYQNNPYNSGVSKAYNEASKFAKRLNKRWLLLLDQDTSFEGEWIAKYLQSTIKHPQHLVKVPIQFSGNTVISPFAYWATKGFASRSFRPGVYPLEKYFAINSGLLIDRKVFESVGGYDESIPLDFSDFAFMVKLKKNNYSLNVIELTGRHSLSSILPQDANSDIARFRHYCLASKKLRNYTHQSFLHFIFAGARAVLLTVRHRSLNFVLIFLRTWLKTG